MTRHGLGDRLFICETLTPLYYSPLYAELTEEQRLRYNQLTGLYSNEVIGYFEEAVACPFAEAFLTMNEEESEPRRGEVERFLAEERKHSKMFLSVNRALAPGLYPREGRLMVRPRPLVAAVVRWMARRPQAFPFLAWLILSQEERSLVIARRCLKKRDQLDPRFVAAHREHLRDESRHVRLDDRFWESIKAGVSPTAYRLNARFFHWLTRTHLISPNQSIQPLTDVWVRISPDGERWRNRLAQALRDVSGNVDYQEMMYSRKGSSRFFSLLDGHPAFAPMSDVLSAYRSPWAVAGAKENSSQ